MQAWQNRCYFGNGVSRWLLSRKKLVPTNISRAEICLDLFHACMRIVQTIPKGSSFCTKFSHEFSLIFHQDGDLGDERKMSTACPIEIESNLERLLFIWTKNLNKDSLSEIEHLRKHIHKGCLSGIPVGYGTEKNERLHWHLNRSLLCGVSKIGPELAIAVMTCVICMEL